MSGDQRAAAARRLLHDAGFTTAEVSVAGHDRGVAVIGGIAPAQLAGVRALSETLKRAGFRYVTLDITDLES